MPKDLIEAIFDTKSITREDAKAFMVSRTYLRERIADNIEFLNEIADSICEDSALLEALEKTGEEYLEPKYGVFKGE